MDVFVVVEEDRHCDVEVTPFAHENEAVQYAQEHLDEMRTYYDDDEIYDGISEAWRRSGCIWNYRYGQEGDGIRVMRKELR